MAFSSVLSVLFVLLVLSALFPAVGRRRYLYCIIERLFLQVLAEMEGKGAAFLPEKLAF